MKKYILPILILLIIILTGCSNKNRLVTKNISNKDKFEVIKDELKNIPENYDLDLGIKDGDFIITNDGLKSDINVLNKFIENSKSGNSSELIVVQYTIEGDPIIKKIKYDGETYYGVTDNTRDKYRGLDYYNFEYLYLKVFNENNEDIYYLVNDESLTYDEIQYYLSKEENYDAMYLLTINNK